MKRMTNHWQLTAAFASIVLVASADARASETDDRIQSSARKSYVFQTFLKADSITIKCEAGIVTLTGTVAREAHKAMAQHTMEGLPGVKAVNNRLEVTGGTTAERSDAWISARVTSSLMFHRSVDGYATQVHTIDGHVTLKGEATSVAQRELTGEYAKDVYGVKDVKNEMTVSKAFGKQDDKTMSEEAGDAKASVDDASITALVKMTLLYHQSTSVLDTTVKTSDGIVTLGGKAKNAAEKDLATKLTQDIHGVKSVVNSMAI